MSKITLTDVKGGFNLTAIQSNFDAIATELQGSVLYRNNPVGEPNTLETDLDMNNKRILNLPAPIGDNEPLRKGDAGSLSSLIASAAGYASTASIKADEAEASALSALASAASADADAIAAAASAVAAEDSSRLTVGTTTTGAPGSSAIVSITGSPGAQALNLTIPRGDVGAAGAGITPQAIGFTVTGGTTPKTLTIALDANVSGTNTGDQTSVTGNAGTVTNGVYTTDKDASGGIPGLTLFKLNLRNAANTITSWFTTAATVARTWTLPDKDGTVAMTSDVVAATQQQAHTFAVSAGTSTAYTATLTPAITDYADGLSFMLRMHATSGASPTLAVNGLAALAMWRRNGTTAGAFAVVTSAGELQQYQYYRFTYSAVSGIWWVDSDPLVIGYNAGAGGTVTQATSRTTGVTLNKPTGAITLFTAAGSATPATFTVTNSLVAAADVPEVVVQSSTNVYLTKVTAVAAGSFNITFWTTGGTASDTPVFNFSVHKGATS